MPNQSMRVTTYFYSLSCKRCVRPNRNIILKNVEVDLNRFAEVHRKVTAVDLVLLCGCCCCVLSLILGRK